MTSSPTRHHYSLRTAHTAGTAGGIVRAARESGFEVIVADVAVQDEDRGMVVTGLHPFRGRFVARFTASGGVDGDAHVVDYVEPYRMVADLRSSSTTVPAAKRKPNGIGVERLEQTGGVMNSTALRAWIKKEQ